MNVWEVTGKVPVFFLDRGFTIDRPKPLGSPTKYILKNLSFSVILNSNMSQGLPNS
jgi:hypothetical protein